MGREELKLGREVVLCDIRGLFETMDLSYRVRGIYSARTFENMLACCDAKAVSAFDFLTSNIANPTSSYRTLSSTAACL